MVSVMSFIVYGGVFGEGGWRDCSDGIGAVPEESGRYAYTRIHFFI